MTRIHEDREDDDAWRAWRAEEERTQGLWFRFWTWVLSKMETR
jgi:hypothetical protein